MEYIIHSLFFIPFIWDMLIPWEDMRYIHASKIYFFNNFLFLTYSFYKIKKINIK